MHKFIWIIDCTLASSEGLAPPSDKQWPQVAYKTLSKEAGTLLLLLGMAAWEQINHISWQLLQPPHIRPKSSSTAPIVHILLLFGSGMKNLGQVQGLGGGGYYKQLRTPCILSPWKQLTAAYNTRTEQPTIHQQCVSYAKGRHLFL